MARKCELCPPLERRTKWYHEDETCAVFDCDTCTPAGAEDHIVVLLKRHTMQPTQEEMKHMLRVVHELGLEVIRWEPRRILGHLHWHARKE